MSSLFGDLPPMMMMSEKKNQKKKEEKERETKTISEEKISNATTSSSWGKRERAVVANATTTRKEEDKEEDKEDVFGAMKVTSTALTKRRRGVESSIGSNDRKKTMLNFTPEQMKMQQFALRAKHRRQKQEQLQQQQQQEKNGAKTTTPNGSTKANNNAREKRAGEWREEEQRGNDGFVAGWDCPDEYDPFKPNSYEDAKLQRTRDDEEKTRREKDWMERKKIKEEAREKEKKEKEQEVKKKENGGGGKGMSMAMKLMKKMGWEEGKGLGKNQDGIDAPLAVKKDGRDTGRIVQSKALFSSKSEKIKGKTNDPTNME
ncbi:unnamed protein product [Bathycoccus prasinos]|mmetsp:Transcript_439/g.1455  ORF Transcript_439/g.1455 Transcript_439/m.1455 type:complete len:317 (+) Transcript_439:221-1171(+)